MAAAVKVSSVACTVVWCLNGAREVCQTGFAWIYFGTELVSGQALIMQANDQYFLFILFVAMVPAHHYVPQYQKEIFNSQKKERKINRRPVGF